MALVETPPGERAQGQARLSLYVDPETESATLTCSAGWWTADGNLRESGLQLSGDLDDTYDLLQEATRWIWARWKKPIKLVGSPFGE